MANVGVLVEYGSVLLAVLCGICILISESQNLLKTLVFSRKSRLHYRC